jgi:hypothetical protein
MVAKQVTTLLDPLRQFYARYIVANLECPTFKTD